MQLTLPHSVFRRGSSLELTWSAQGAPWQDQRASAEAMHAVAMFAAGSVIAVLTSLFALLRLRRSRSPAHS